MCSCQKLNIRYVTRDFREFKCVNVIRYEENKTITKSSKNANAIKLENNLFSLARTLGPILGESSDHCNISVQLLLRSIKLCNKIAIR